MEHKDGYLELHCIFTFALAVGRYIKRPILCEYQAHGASEQPACFRSYILEIRTVEQTGFLPFSLHPLE